MLICCVVGARPNMMKIAPIVRELGKRGIPNLLVHTGQHYDKNMSEVFFEELGLPEPEVYLGVGSDTPARQIARIMMGIEDICRERAPTLVVVGGDVNSTLAAALAAAKAQIPVAHVEAGLRSFDRTMPEEINRLLVDQLSDLLFTTEESANRNLRREGFSERQILFVGNCMVDTLLRLLDLAISAQPWESWGLTPRGYALLTLHRPSNVDNPLTLQSIMDTVNGISEIVPVVFPVHPRTQRQIQRGEIRIAPTVRRIPPLPYLSFVGLMAMAKLVLTDSGGVQEETTVLNVPCLTLRWNTERPVTLQHGTNCLVGTSKARILAAVDKVLDGQWVRAERPPLWDGHAGERIVEHLQRWAESHLLGEAS